MKATKTPGNITVTLEMSDEEFQTLINAWVGTWDRLPESDAPRPHIAKFFNLASEFIGLVIDGGEKEINA